MDETLLRELYQSLDQRRRPEEIAARVRRALAGSVDRQTEQALRAVARYARPAGTACFLAYAAPSSAGPAPSTAPTRREAAAHPRPAVLAAASGKEVSMAKNPLPLRTKRYFKLSAHIAQMDNAHLRALFDDSEASGGWGRHHTLEMARTKVFVKRVPVTELEYQNMLSTANLYDLPTFYNYGVGSAGLGVFRELVAYIKTTNWVLGGAISTFPLTYHYRIVPFSGKRADVDVERHQGYVEYWGGNENIGRYMLDRAKAPYELVLFLEHVPYTLAPWLLEHPDKLDRSLNDLRGAITFLRKHGIIHFDAHFHNVVTDGEQAYLTDFGLVLDRSFALTKEEQSFFRRHTYYDYGEVLGNIVFPMLQSYERLPEIDKGRLQEKYGIAESSGHHEVAPLLLANIEEIHGAGMLNLKASYVASLVKYRGVITLMHDFFSDMQKNKKKDTKLRHTDLRRLLKETGFASTSGGE